MSKKRPALLPLAVLLFAPGCARHTAAPKPTVTPAVVAKADMPLPSWAPKHPSKEFLRAARMLKPVPEEAQPYSPLYLPAWELFGTLTDQQVREFLTRRQYSEPIAGMEKSQIDDLKEHQQAKQVGDKLVYYYHDVTVKVSSFSPRQRAIFANLRKASQEASQGKPGEDLLVLLYKMGAKKDLSNVEISFNVNGGHAVFLMVRPTAGGWCAGEWVAQI